MAKSGRPIEPEESRPPQSFAQVPPPPGSPMLDHSFMLQTMIELQRSFTKIETKTDRLIQDVEKHGDKIDAVRGKINFVQGAAWAIGGLLVVAISLAAILIKTKWLGG